MESKNKKNLGTRILLLKRKRKRDEIKIKTAKKYQKLERLLIFANKRKRKIQGIV